MKFFFYPGNKTMNYVELTMSKSPINNLTQKLDGSTNSNSNSPHTNQFKLETRGTIIFIARFKGSRSAHDR
jgi:hypothetical protein